MTPEVQAYIDSVTDARRDLLLQFHQLTMELYPQAEVRISYQILRYQMKPGWLYLGYWKQGVSIYMGYINSFADFKAKYPKIKAGKGSINFKLTDAVPWKDVQQIIHQAMQNKRAENG